MNYKIPLILTPQPEATRSRRRSCQSWSPKAIQWRKRSATSRTPWPLWLRPITIWVGHCRGTLRFRIQTLPCGSKPW